MKINNAKLVAVTAWPKQYPEDNMVEIAFAGRSNVGKSSLLNLLTNRKKLARVSGSPGKTQTINFYEIDGNFRIVDLPGYGYAKVSKSLSQNWGEMIETYLENRNGLKKVIQLVDIRHKPTSQDVQMYEYLKYYGLDGTVVATKGDKVSRNQIKSCLKVIRETLGMSDNDVIIPVSALKKEGKEELLNRMENIIKSNKID